MLEGALRTCGDCVACCVYLRIEEPELKKEGMRHCPHVMSDEPEIPGKRVCYTGKGCRIYESRPKTCAGFQCEWLKGHGEEADRPDRCGILIDRSKGIENAIECKPLWSKAYDEPAGRDAIERISKSTGEPALVISFYETHLVKVVGRA
jgi:hypothetical protein